MMSLHHVSHDRPKGIAEHGVCFGVAAGGLIAVAVLLQWILHLAA
jgi:hypothetical protein